MCLFLSDQYQTSSGMMVDEVKATRKFICDIVLILLLFFVGFAIF